MNTAINDEDNVVSPPNFHQYEYKQFNEYKPGDEIAGQTIQYVAASSENYIIAKTENGGLFWKSNVAYTAIQEYAQTRYKLIEPLTHTIIIPSERYSHILALEQAFIIGFQAEHLTKDELSKIFDDIKEKIQGANQADITVLVKDSDFLVTRDAQGYLSVHTAEGIAITPEISHALYRARSLYNYCVQLLPSKEHKLSADHISEAFTKVFALHHSDTLQLTIKDVDSFFEDVYKFLNNQILANLRAKFLFYTASSACFMVLFITIVFSLVEIPQTYFHASFAALAGSFVSVLQRNNSIALDPLTSSRGLVVDALSRIWVGITFGIFTIMLAESELALATFNNNSMALMVFAFIAGFTERFAPDMIENVTIDKANGSETPRSD
ncbi:hypothetical protein [Vibrio ouci]|uniref:Uncharacterized protein n=1 Tax=Vibrio ouci TaxID=2499078 RepID=A0A4Y8WIS3_9VIBR|nr:hypothetical protein [Vibrio ouci]TFH92495.1 hypothetical protein ELS82_06180 [Vibrio ouci]